MVLEPTVKTEEDVRMSKVLRTVESVLGPPRSFVSFNVKEHHDQDVKHTHVFVYTYTYSHIYHNSQNGTGLKCVPGLPRCRTLVLTARTSRVPPLCTVFLLVVPITYSSNSFLDFKIYPSQSDFSLVNSVLHFLRSLYTFLPLLTTRNPREDRDSWSEPRLRTLSTLS